MIFIPLLFLRLSITLNWRLTPTLPSLHLATLTIKYHSVWVPGAMLNDNLWRVARYVTATFVSSFNAPTTANVIKCNKLIQFPTAWLATCTRTCISSNSWQSGRAVIGICITDWRCNRFAVLNFLLTPISLDSDGNAITLLLFLYVDLRSTSTRNRN